MDCPQCFYNYNEFLMEYGTDQLNYVEFLKGHGVFRHSVDCPHCGAVCSEDIRKLSFRCRKWRVVDGVRIKCNYSLSMKADTWLKGTRLPVKTVCQLVCLWLLTPQSRTVVIRAKLGVAEHTVVDWSYFCREICLNSLVMIDDQILGGPGMIVEVDEAKLGKRKYNRGRVVEGSWILGAFERGTGRYFFEVVQDRSAATLLGIVKGRIAAGTIIVTDLWRGYNALVASNYQHLTINHCQNFVGLDTGAHTHNIERMWQEVRASIPRFSRIDNHLQGYLAEFFWKRRHPENERLHHFFLEVARQHNPHG